MNQDLFESTPQESTNLRSELVSQIPNTKQEEKHKKPKRKASRDFSLLPTASAAHQLGADISALRLTSRFGEQFSVKKSLITVPVGKPNKSKFFQVRPGDEWEFPAYIVELKESGETYVTTEAVASVIPETAKPVLLCLAIDRRGNPMLIPVPLPGEDGKRNQWHQSLSHAVEKAKTSWVRLVANMSAGAYDVLVAQSPLEKPQWTEHNLTQLIEIAFRDRVIASVDHPVVRELLGLA